MGFGLGPKGVQEGPGGGPANDPYYGGPRALGPVGLGAHMVFSVWMDWGRELRTLSRLYLGSWVDKTAQKKHYKGEATHISS